jgi:hypothetical protein
MPLPAIQSAQFSIFSQMQAIPLPAWSGKKPHQWAGNVSLVLQALPGVSRTALTRSALRSMWLNPAIATEVCVLSTMAWGGMKTNHGQDFWTAKTHWLPLCDEVRQGKHTRRSAFDAFSKLKASGKLPCMGPAYFTKIIFFADHKADGYILDQWTARSVHMLTGQCQWPSVLTDHESKKMAVTDPTKLRLRVVDKVTGADYEDFCVLVEDVGGRLGIHPHLAEEQLFSIGGKHAHPWRTHVMTAWTSQSPVFYR